MLKRSVYAVSYISVLGAMILGAALGCGTNPDTTTVARYSQPCAASGFGGVDASWTYGQQTVSVPTGGGVVTITMKLYSDAACTSTNLSQTLTYTVLMSNVGSATGVTRGTETNVAGVLKTNAIYKAVTWEAATTAQAAITNGATLCGLSNWAAATPQSIAGLTCMGGAIPAPPVDFVSYTLTALSGANLYLGEPAGGSDDGTTDAKRHTALDAVAYVKQ